MNDFTTFDDDQKLLALNDAAAAELDTIGAQLLESTERMQAIHTMSEPVRADAIAIARDILRKLKIKLGAANVLEGLGLKTRGDAASLGGLTIVSQLYEHLLAWGRGIDASIMSDPSVQAAIDAFGVIGYLAKREALRIARTSQDMFLADSIAKQLDQTHGKFLNSGEQNFGKLLETIERGMDRILTRVQDLSVSGAGVSHAQKELGSTMTAAPVAGLSMQIGADGSRSRDAVGKRNAEALIAEELAAQAEAARIAAQNAARAKKDSKAPPAAPARPTGGGRQGVVQQARAQQRSGNIAITGTMTAAQMQNRINSARMANIHNHQAHEEEEHHIQDQQALQRLLQRQQAARKTVHQVAPPKAADVGAPKITAPMIQPEMLKGFKPFDMPSGMKAEPIATGTADYAKQHASPVNGLKPMATPTPVIDPNDPHKGMAR